MPSIFSKIVAGEIPCHRVWEDEEHLAFLDIQPWAEGHTLVIPKLEEDDLFKLSPQRAEALWRSAHHVAQILKTHIECERVAVLVLGYEVPHVHIHLIPTRSEREVLEARRTPTDHVALASLATRLRNEESNRESNEDTQTPDPSTESIASRWDEFATRFVMEAEPVTLRAARAAIDHLDLAQATSILEVGCGGGAAGVELRRRLDREAPLAQLTLTDISTEMIRIAQNRFEHEDQVQKQRNFGALGWVSIEQADAQALHYPDASFDRFFSCLNLMLVPHFERAISESARVLKPRGKAVWVVWGRPEHSHMMTLTPQALNQMGIKMPTPARSNFHLGGLDTLKEKLKEYGFTAVRRWYQPMITDIETGEAFTEMTLRLRPELIELLEAEGKLNEFKSVLTELANQRLNRGEGIGLDALVVTAKRAD